MVSVIAAGHDKHHPSSREAATLAASRGRRSEPVRYFGMDISGVRSNDRSTFARAEATVPQSNL